MKSQEERTENHLEVERLRRERAQAKEQVQETAQEKAPASQDRGQQGSDNPQEPGRRNPQDAR